MLTAWVIIQRQDFDHATQTGVVFHLMGTLSNYSAEVVLQHHRCRQTTLDCFIDVVHWNSVHCRHVRQGGNDLYRKFNGRGASYARKSERCGVGGAGDCLRKMMWRELEGVHGDGQTKNATYWPFYSRSLQKSSLRDVLDSRQCLEHGLPWACRDFIHWH